MGKKAISKRHKAKVEEKGRNGRPRGEIITNLELRILGRKREVEGQRNKGTKRQRGKSGVRRDKEIAGDCY